MKSIETFKEKTKVTNKVAYKIIKTIILLLITIITCGIKLNYVEAAEIENTSIIDIQETTIEENSIADLGVLNQGGVSKELIQKFNEAYMLIPENVREHFTNNGWTIYATTEDIGQKYYGHKISILALTVIDEKAIYIDNRKKATNSVIHEMGHYIDYINGFISSSDEFIEIYNEEIKTFCSIHSTHTNNTSTTVEYFAEFYMVAILNPKVAKDRCPRTYEFVMGYANEL